eukprot:1160304-Pyramimonas_sp.AAC.1
MQKRTADEPASYKVLCRERPLGDGSVQALAQLGNSSEDGAQLRAQYLKFRERRGRDCVKFEAEVNDWWTRKSESAAARYLKESCPGIHKTSNAAI